MPDNNNNTKKSMAWINYLLQAAISFSIALITAMLFLGDMRTEIKLNKVSGNLRYEKLEDADIFLKELYETKLNSLTDMVKEMNKKIDELQKDYNNHNKE